MYKVFCYKVSSPLNLERWLESVTSEGLVLIAATGDYFIFANESECTIRQTVGTIEQGAKVTGVKIDRLG